MIKVFISVFFILVGLSLYLFPEIDIFMSNLFYNPNKGFTLRYNFYTHNISKAAIFLVFIIFLWLSCKLIIHYCKTQKIDIKILYLLIVCSMVPGFVIHKIVKEHYHRARPYSIEKFGGTAKFTPAPIVGDQCYENCSFVSSHAAIGFMFFAFAFVKRGKQRRNMMIFATFFGLFLGFIRIMQGKHFLSDVLYSGMITFLISYFLYILLGLDRENKVKKPHQLSRSTKYS